MNLVELVTDDMQEPAPCRYGNIVVGHACYCHNSDENAPRKCPIWRNGGRWSKDNCDFFEPAKVVAGDTAPDGHNDRVEGRDAALSRRVPSHAGLCPGADNGERTRT